MGKRGSSVGVAWELSHEAQLRAAGELAAGGNAADAWDMYTRIVASRTYPPTPGVADAARAMVGLLPQMGRRVDLDEAIGDRWEKLEEEMDWDARYMEASNW